MSNQPSSCTVELVTSLTSEELISRYATYLREKLGVRSDVSLLTLSLYGTLTAYSFTGSKVSLTFSDLDLRINLRLTQSNILALNTQLSS
jgi:hypothetical protein